ncbi:DUF6612 family protein [Peribacillus sp. SCS-26]|uniref:DUF6612 family protein n=1 Tax=Paraperibacillus marinus TaxID=3115295 RepID=UPI0039061285
MKKTILFTTALIVFALLSGCGTKASKEDVINGAFKKPINSFDAEMKTEFEISANGQKSNQTIDMDIKYLDKPFITHLVMDTIDGEMELYLDKEYAYIDSGDSTWMKTPTDSVPEFKDLASDDSVKEDLENIKKFEELFELEEIKDGYNLKVNLDKTSSQKEKDLVLKMLDGNMGEEKPDSIKINKFDYTLTLDKEYNIKKVVTDASIKMEKDGQSGDVKVKLNADYKNMNSVKSFSIPEDVKANAVES